MSASDKFIGYLNRSSEQIEEDIKSKFPLYLPEITDIDNDPLFQFSKIWAGILENLHYYLDRRTQEAFLPVAKRFESGILAAESSNYRVKGSYPASADITFYFDTPAPSNVVIPAGTIVSTEDNIPFVTKQNVTITTGNTQATVGAFQYQKYQNINIGTTNGQPSQVFLLPEKVVDYDIILTIGTNVYGQVDTFFFSTKDDLHFIPSINKDNRMQVKLGDGITGKIPTNLETVLASYYVSEGLNGNVGANKITDVISSVTVPSGMILKCKNTTKASGGTNAETLIDLKKRIPLHRSTLKRAVTPEDYVALAELYPGVERAGEEHSCQSINLYIYPTGGGIASQALIDDVYDYLLPIKMFGHKLNVYAAGEVQIKMKVDIYILPNYVKNTVLNNAINNIVALGSNKNKVKVKVKGKIAIGDIYQAIETAEGVDYSDLIKIYPIPYAKPLTNKVLDWEVDILEGSQNTVSWKIIFSSSTEYQLIRNNAFFGNYNVTQQVNTNEISLKINAGSYVLGDSWEFKIYKYNGNLVLEEPSLPILSSDNIEANIIGGI
ncbi:MAG: baseplate J/gp47 family protein [Raineya sp.]|jgi:hypothetical protein|nr:baseplate J/gp47 family protein [Raineya sp.]